MSYRPNPALDDAFGIEPVAWGREPDQLPPPKKPARNPAETVPVRLPEGFMLENGRMVRVPETDIEMFRRMLEQDKRDAARMLETVSPGDAGRPLPAAPTPEVRTDSPSGEIARPAQSHASPEPVVIASIPEPATVLEKEGEDLLYLDGRWWHRCNHCGDTEIVIIPAKGHQRSPRRETRPVFPVPRGFSIRHGAGCPYAGRF